MRKIEGVGVVISVAGNGGEEAVVKAVNETTIKQFDSLKDIAADGVIGGFHSADAVGELKVSGDGFYSLDTTEGVFLLDVTGNTNYQLVGEVLEELGYEGWLDSPVLVSYACLLND